MKNILDKIKEYNTIIIHGHIRPDGDCIGSQYGLMYLIKKSFPDKNVYVTGDSSNYVSFLGIPKMIDGKLFSGALSICVDCPRSDRLSDERFNLSKYSIKIDHHFDSEKYTDYEYVDYNASSCTQIITEFYMNFKNELIMSKECAEALYTGLLTDTGRFQNSNISSKTFIVASELLNYGVDIIKINNNLSLESESSLRLKGYCLNNFKVTQNGVVYIILKKEIISEFGVGDEEAASIVSSISSLKGCPVWTLVLETEDTIRIRLRSRGPAINELAQKYNGGGHKLASGGRLNSWDDLDQFINDADALLREFKN